MIFKGVNENSIDGNDARDDDRWGMVMMRRSRLKERLNQRKEIHSLSSLSGDQSSLDQQQQNRQFPAGSMFTVLQLPPCNKVSSAASKTQQFCNFHMCKTTFIMLCRVIMCNKHRLKRQHLHIQFWGPIRCWKKCPLGVTNMRSGCIVLHSASRPHLIRCHRAGSDFEVASYKAPTLAKHCTCQLCSAMQLAL